MQDTQLLKGILEGCVLGIIAKKETYGYEILQSLESYGFDGIGEGTLYPVLTRLDKNGYILARKAQSPLGPVRKYYSITEKGLIYYKLFLKNYYSITKRANRIFEAQEEE